MKVIKNLASTVGTTANLLTESVDELSSALTHLRVQNAVGRMEDVLSSSIESHESLKQLLEDNSEIMEQEHFKTMYGLVQDSTTTLNKRYLEELSKAKVK